MKRSGEFGLAFLLELVQIVGRHADDFRCVLVESAEPHLTGGIGDVGREDVAVFRGGEGAITSFAAPATVHVLRDLFVAFRRGAGSVVKVVLLDVDDGTANVEVVGFVRHAQVFVLDLSDRAAFVHVATCATGTSSCTTKTGIGERLELRMSSIVIVPPAKHVRLGDIGVDRHSRAGKHAERSAAKIAHFDALECNHRLLVHSRVVGERLCILTPQRETNALATLVNERELSLLNRPLRSLADDLAQVSIAIQDSDHIACVVGLHFLELADADKLVLDLGHVRHIGAFLDLGRVLKGDLVFVLQVAELLLGDVDASFRDEVDVVLLEKRVEAVNGVIEAGSFDLTAVIEKVDGEELALTALVGPVTDVGLGGNAGFDSPAVLVGREAFDRVDGHAGVDAAATWTARTTYLARTRARARARSGSGWRGPARRVVAKVAVAERVVAALLLDTTLALDCILNIGWAAETVSCGRVDDLKIEKNENAAVLDRVAGVLRDADDAVSLELAGLDHRSLLRGEHGLSIVLAVGEDDTVAIADVVSGGVVGLDLFDAEDLADGVLDRAGGIGRLDHLRDCALRESAERHGHDSCLRLVQSRVVDGEN